jgi:hypothetical protein
MTYEYQIIRLKLWGRDWELAKHVAEGWEPLSMLTSEARGYDRTTAEHLYLLCRRQVPPR